MRADIAVVAFNSEHQVVRNFGEHVDFSQPTLQAAGGTDSHCRRRLHRPTDLPQPALSRHRPPRRPDARQMAPPINTALNMIEQRKLQYREAGIPYYRPIVMLITDGRPEHDLRSTTQDMARSLVRALSCTSQRIAQRIKAAENSRSVTFFAIGTETANMDALAALSNLPPKTLRGANFVRILVPVRLPRSPRTVPVAVELHHRHQPFTAGRRRGSAEHRRVEQVLMTARPPDDIHHQRLSGCSMVGLRLAERRAIGQHQGHQIRPPGGTPPRLHGKHRTLLPALRHGKLRPSARLCQWFDTRARDTR